MSSTYIYASCKDINGIREYLAASTEKEIEDYCENGTLGHERDILHWYTNPTPIMASSHFIWVGKGKRPPMLSISKPFNYKNPNAIVREKW